MGEQELSKSGRRDEHSRQGKELVQGIFSSLGFGILKNLKESPV